MPPPGDHGLDRQLSVRDAARNWAPDYYISALLAPAEVRDDLIALAAFWGETGRIALTVGNDLLGEIRLQWWRDAVAAGAKASGHPVADAVQGLMAKHRLEPVVLEGMLDARGEELRRLPFDNEAGFDAYLAGADGALLALGAKIRGIDLADWTPQHLLAGAARALGRVRIALDLPYFAANSRLPLWPAAAGETDHVDGSSADNAAGALAELGRGARKALAEVLPLAERADRRLIDAVLPLALLEPYLRALEIRGRDPLRDVAAISPLNRVFRLTWAHVRGRV